MQQLPDTKIVIAKVFAVIPEFHLAYCEDENGWRYGLTRHNEGLQYTDVVEGDILELEVTVKFPRTLKAKHVGQS